MAAIFGKGGKYCKNRELSIEAKNVINQLELKVSDKPLVTS
jgi:hypothetical protein